MSNFTPAEKAAFKAANLAAETKVVTLWAEHKPAKLSHRQQWVEAIKETDDMIRAAKREGHVHLLPQLWQRRRSFALTLATVS